MARAKVELKDAVSFSRRGVQYRKGEPRVVTDPGEIAYLRSQPAFVVTDLPDAQPAPAAPATAPKVEASPQSTKTKAKASASLGGKKKASEDEEAPI